MRFRLATALIAALLCLPFVHAQDTAALLARELVTLKGGYAEKKRQLEELRIRAYVPILLKAVGKGMSWKPDHPNWAETERRIGEEWRKHYMDYLVRMGRDTGYGWTDDAVAREYAKVFSAEELGTLIAFYRSPPGASLLLLEKEFLAFYPDDMLRALSRVMLGTESLTTRDKEHLRAANARERRDFAELFESELVIHAETLRIGSPYIDATQSFVQQGALATAAERIDTLRRRLDGAVVQELQAFLKSEPGRKERVFIGAAVAAATPADENPERARQEEIAFYKGLGQLSAQWRELATRSPAKPQP